MNAADIKKKLFKPATIFETGGFRPTEALGESWIGAVMWGEPGDVVPENYDPLFTLFLTDLEHVPEALRGIELITVSIDNDVFNRGIWDNLALCFDIRCYTSLDDLQKLNARSSVLVPHPLHPITIINDSPDWEDDDGISSDLQSEIIQWENISKTNYHEDVVEDIYSEHKVGGYPSYIQGGVSFGDEYSFGFQISTDNKAKYNIVDGGSFYFFL